MSKDRAVIDNAVDRARDEAMAQGEALQAIAQEIERVGFSEARKGFEVFFFPGHRLSSLRPGETVPPNKQLWERVTDTQSLLMFAGMGYGEKQVIRPTHL